jgi:hypothetical protein
MSPSIFLFQFHNQPSHASTYKHPSLFHLACNQSTTLTVLMLEVDLNRTGPLRLTPSDRAKSRMGGR